MKIGIHLDSLGLPLRPALTAAAKMDVTGVKFNSSGTLSPTQLTQTGRRELRHLLRGSNLEFVAVGCPLRHGLDTLENMEGRITHVREVMQLAYDLGPRLVTIQPGQVPEKDDDPRLPLLREVLAELGAHGDRIGTTLALETGLESGAALAQFLNHFDTGSLGVSFDPANLLMNGFRPFEDLRALQGKIVLVQAKDARKHTASRAAREAPLGAGDLDWMGLLDALRELEYRRWVVVQRDSAPSLEDIRQGVAFLRRLVS